MSLTLMNFCISLAHREGRGCKGMCRGEVLINALGVRGEERWWSLIQCLRWNLKGCKILTLYSFNTHIPWFHHLIQLNSNGHKSVGEKQT